MYVGNVTVNMAQRGGGNSKLHMQASLSLVHDCEFVDIDVLCSVHRSRGSGVTVSVLLHWEPPKEGDLPVHHYRVTWISQHTHTAHRHTHPLHANTQTMQSNMHTVPAQPHIPDLGRKESNSRVTQGVRTHSAFTHSDSHERYCRDGSLC